MGCYCWTEYGNNYLINSESENDRWLWCFSWDWEVVDNTHRGAGLRIKWLLENGLPENWRLQMKGIDRLCYLGEQE